MIATTIWKKLLWFQFKNAQLQIDFVADFHFQKTYIITN